MDISYDGVRSTCVLRFFLCVVGCSDSSLWEPNGLVAIFIPKYKVLLLRPTFTTRSKPSGRARLSSRQHPESSLPSADSALVLVNPIASNTSSQPSLGGLSTPFCLSYDERGLVPHITTTTILCCRRVGADRTPNYRIPQVFWWLRQRKSRSGYVWEYCSDATQQPHVRWRWG